MLSVPQSPSTSIRPGSRDTGFPDGMCGVGNTRLPHPEADLSPDATISADNVSVNELQARSHHRSILHKSNRRTLSHGVITPEMERMSTAQEPIPETEADTLLSAQPNVPGRRSKDGSESLDRTDTSGTGDDDVPTAPRAVSSGSATASLEAPKADAERRKSMLRKFRLN